MKRSSDDTMNASDLEERLRQVQFTQDTVMKKTHTTAVAFQEVTATIAVEETTTNPEETVIHVVEAMTATVGAEETTPVTTIEMATATQAVRQHHLLDPQEQVIEAAIETGKVI